jgi:hypothetical protein
MWNGIGTEFHILAEDPADCKNMQIYKEKEEQEHGMSNKEDMRMKRHTFGRWQIAVHFPAYDPLRPTPRLPIHRYPPALSPVPNSL